MLCFSGCRLLGGGFRDNKWILLSFGCTNVDFVVGRWISWISLFRQTDHHTREAAQSKQTQNEFKRNTI